MFQPPARVIAALNVPVGERPLVREIAEWRVWPIFALRALALQGMDPVIMKSLEDHSILFADPLSRARDTMAFAESAFFGDTAAVAAQIRELHRHISGRGYDGKAYHAWNRESWTWVHLTGLEAMLYAVEVSFPGIDRHLLEAAYQTGRMNGLALGVREEDMPSDLDGLRDFVADHLAEHLVETAGSRRLRDLFLDNPGLAVPGPSWLQRAVGLVAARPIQTLAFGTFPGAVRDAWHVNWTPLREKKFRMMIALMRIASAPLPDALRMRPVAYRALRGVAVPSRPHHSDIRLAG